MMSAPEPFPTEWRTALVLVPHPDDPEYGIGAAVAKWTTAGKTVHYALASRGEAGIAGMPPEQAARVREREQRRSAAIVGVNDVQFWDFPDSRIRDTDDLRAKISETITELAPDVVITIYSGPEWEPGAPNQRDHIEFAHAVAAAYDSLAHPPKWLFENGPELTHGEDVDGYVEVAAESLAAHETYLSVLDPDTPVGEQARRQVEVSTKPRADFGGHHTVEFILKRSSISR
jgi:LmbE family N-acetylglucosaminyl deacetylase